MKIFKNANLVIKYQNLQKFSQINLINRISYKYRSPIKNNQYFSNYNFISKGFTSTNKIDSNIKVINIDPVSDDNQVDISKNFNKVQQFKTKEEISEEKQLFEYLENFIPLKTMLKINRNKKQINIEEDNKINQIKLIDFIQCREFLEANFYLLKQNYKKSEEIFLKLKNILRSSGYIGTYIYNIALRRLGICKLLQNKISEGLLELENVFEFSNERDNFSSSYRFNSMVELLKSYTLYFPTKASQFAEKILKDEKDLKLWDINQLAELNHYISVRKINFKNPYKYLYNYMFF
jgi:hypothetical protein